MKRSETMVIYIYVCVCIHTLTYIRAHTHTHNVALGDCGGATYRGLSAPQLADFMLTRSDGGGGAGRGSFLVNWARQRVGLGSPLSLGLVCERGVAR